MMGEPTEESCNFARLSMLVFDPGQDSMRELLKHVTRGCDVEQLSKTIKEKLEHGGRNTGKLLDYEREALEPTIQFDKLDFSFMYKIARNVLWREIVKLDGSKAKWGEKPNENDLSVLAAVERIRCVRNSDIAHATKAQIPQQEFDTLWERMMCALETIQKVLGPQKDYKSMGASLKRQYIDTAAVRLQKELVQKEKLIEDLLELNAATSEEMKIAISSMEDAWKKNKEQWQIKTGQREPKEWKNFVRIKQDRIQQLTDNFFARHFKEDDFFVETKAFDRAKEILQEFKRVTIKGFPGSGKTKMAVHLVLDMLRANPVKYFVRKLEAPKHLKTEKPDENQIIFIDDIFGTGVVNSDIVREWAENYKLFTSFHKGNEESLEENSMKGSFFIVTSRTNPVSSAVKINKTHPLLEDGVVVDLTPLNFLKPNEKKCPTCPLDPNERKEILRKQFISCGKVMPENISQDLDRIVGNFMQGPHGFPFCAKLFASEEKFLRLGYEFFAQPHHHLLDLVLKNVNDSDLNRNALLILLFHEQRKKMCGEETETKHLDFQNEDYCKDLLAERKLRHLVESEEDDIDIKDLENAAKGMKNLLTKSVKTFSFVHESVPDAVEVYYMQEFFDTAIWNIDLKSLVSKIQVTDTSSYYVNVKSDRYPLLIERLVHEILEGENVQWVCESSVWKCGEFLSHFSSFITDKAKEDQTQAYIERLALSIHLDEHDHNHRNLLSVALQKGHCGLGLCLLEHLLAAQEKKAPGAGIERKVRTRLSWAMFYGCGIKLPDTLQKMLNLFKDLGASFNYCEVCSGRNVQQVTTPGKNTIHISATRQQKHTCCLEYASAIRNDFAIQILLKHGAAIPHNRWNGWPFLHKCAQFNDMQLCNHKFISALEKFHTSRCDSENCVLEGSSEDNYERISDLIHSKCQVPTVQDYLVDMLTELITEMELTPEIVRVFKQYSIVIGNEVDQSTSMPNKSESINTESTTEEKSNKEHPDLETVAESEGLVHVYGLLHSIVRSRMSHKMLLRRDLSLTEVEEIRKEQSVEDDDDDAVLSKPKNLREKYLEKRERSLKQKTIKNLVQHGCRIDHRNKEGESVLLTAATQENTDVELIKTILELGADPNLPDKGGCVPLHYIVASKLDDQEAALITKVLIDKGAIVTVSKHSGETPLSMAIDAVGKKLRPRTEVLRTLLKSPVFRNSYQKDKNVAKESGVVHHVIEGLFTEKQKLTVLALLQEELGRLHLEKDSKGHTPLMKCSIHCAEMMELQSFFLRLSSNVEDQDLMGNTVLHHIVSTDFGMETKMNAIKALGENIESIVNVRNEGKLTPLMLVMRQNMVSLELVRHLISAGADITAKDGDGLDSFAQTIKYAFQPSKIFARGEQNVRKGKSLILFPGGETVQWPDKNANGEDNGERSNEISKERELIDIMMEKAKDLNNVDNLGRTCLHHVMESILPDKDAAFLSNRLLIKYKLDVDQTDKSGKSPLVLAFERSSGKVELLKSCVSASHEIKKWSQKKLYELVARPGCLQEDLIQYLVHQGVLYKDKASDPNLFHHLAQTGYMSFKQEEDRRVFGFLKSYFNINKKDSSADTPLIIACLKGAPIACIANLVENGADVTCRTAAKLIPAHIVIDSDRSDTDVRLILDKYLLTHESCVNSQDENGLSPLALALSCRMDRQEVVQLLLNKGADVTLRDNSGETVLHLCVQNPERTDFECQHLLELLLNTHSVDSIINAKNTSDLTALNITASLKKQSRILSMLRLLQVDKCRVDSTDAFGRTPLLNCIHNLRTLGFRPVVDLERLVRICILLVFGAKNCKDANGESVSDLCSKHPHHEDIRTLVLKSSHQNIKYMTVLMNKYIMIVEQTYKASSLSIPDIGLDRLERNLLDSVKSAALFLCDDELSLNQEASEYDENTTSDYCQ